MDGEPSVISTQKLKKRAMNLTELHQIRSRKGDDLSFVFQDELYTNYWDYIQRSLMPTWKREGVYTFYLFQPLMSLIEAFFDQDPGVFQTQLSRLEFRLSSCPARDVNYLYGLEIELPDNQSGYLIDLLLDARDLDSSLMRQDLESRFLALAKTICQANPSIISTSPALAKIHALQKAGPWFDLAHLHQLIANLDIPHPTPIRPRSASPHSHTETSPRARPSRRMENHSQSTIQAHPLDDQYDLLQEAHNELLTFTDSQLTSKPYPRVWQFLIGKIKNLYTIYWNLIIDTPDDYFRCKNSKNHPWILLAQYLAGAGHIDSDYYKVLIPTLTQSAIEPLGQESLTAHPLHEFILSGDNSELIHIQNTKERAKILGQLDNFNARVPRPLVSKEKNRLKAVAPDVFEHFFTKRLFMSHEPSISLATIEALKALVNGSVNNEGLTQDIISPDQYSLTEQSFSDLVAYLSTIAPDEENRLYQQRINYNGDSVLFSELMDATQASIEEKRRCATQIGVYIAKLVIDYNHNARFSDAIEQNPNLKERLRYMRDCSARKIPRDYDLLDTDAANKRAMTLLVALLTSTLDYQNFTGNIIQLFDYSNTVPKTAKKIFEILRPAADISHLRHIRYDYTHMQEHILRPAVATPHSGRYENTQQWYEQALSDDFFSSKTKTCFEPESILNVLWTMARTNSELQNTLEALLDKLMQIYLSITDSNTKWIKLNIELTKFLMNGCLPDHKNKILEALRDNESTKTNSETLIQMGKAFFITRLALAGCSNLSGMPWLKLFSPSPNPRNSLHYDLLINDLHTQIDPMAAVPDEPELTLQQIIKELHRFLESDGQYLNKIPMKNYLKPFLQEAEEINHPICSSSSTVLNT